MKLKPSPSPSLRAAAFALVPFDLGQRRMKDAMMLLVILFASSGLIETEGSGQFLLQGKFDHDVTAKIHATSMG
jgi:hypothetical protein